MRDARCHVGSGDLGDAFFAASGVGHAATRYCSPSGDYCVAAERVHGVRTLSFSSFAHRGRVRVCITFERAIRNCRRFQLTPDAEVPSIYQFKRRWTRSFPYHGAGRYDVRYVQRGEPIGPTLTFRAR